MQTRRASKAAAAAAAGTLRSRATTAAAAVAVTPSPSRKKHKARRCSSASGTASGEAIAFGSDDGVRGEMRSLVLSHIRGEGDVSNGGDGVDTTTIGGWCLVDGLAHCAAASDGILLPLIKEHGPPQFYLDHVRANVASNPVPSEVPSNGDDGDDYKSFRSLCRIVSGQQLAGNAAKTIWRRLLQVVDATEEDSSNLTPERILSIAENGDVESDLRSPAGLSNAKCKCIVAIAAGFRDGNLSDEILLGGEASDDEVRNLLLSIKGLGPWSVDMFCLFQVHKSNVLPIGDLAFRNGTRNLWGVKGQAKGGGLCQKKDRHVMERCHAPFEPYRSISSYYMYKCSGMK